MVIQNKLRLLPRQVRRHFMPRARLCCPGLALSDPLPSLLSKWHQTPAAYHEGGRPTKWVKMRALWQFQPPGTGWRALCPALAPDRGPSSGRSHIPPSSAFFFICLFAFLSLIPNLPVTASMYTQQKYKCNTFVPDSSGLSWSRRWRCWRWRSWAGVVTCGLLLSGWLDELPNSSLETIYGREMHASMSIAHKKCA